MNKSAHFVEGKFQEEKVHPEVGRSSKEDLAGGDENVVEDDDELCCEERSGGRVEVPVGDSDRGPFEEDEQQLGDAEENEEADGPTVVVKIVQARLPPSPSCHTQSLALRILYMECRQSDLTFLLVLLVN